MGRGSSRRPRFAVARGAGDAVRLQRCIEYLLVDNAARAVSTVPRPAPLGGLAPLNHFWYISKVKRLPAAFYQTAAGAQPVRDWLRGLSAEDRKAIGDDIRTVEFGWPIGMPTCRPLGNGLFEVRTNLDGGRIAPVLFAVEQDHAVLLHGFIKKSRKTPQRDLKTTKQRLVNLKERLRHD
jgi:phage-related protein